MAPPEGLPHSPQYLAPTIIGLPHEMQNALMADFPVYCRGAGVGVRDYYDSSICCLRLRLAPRSDSLVSTVT
jgi:hypothetical protein